MSGRYGFKLLFAGVGLASTLLLSACAPVTPTATPEPTRQVRQGQQLPRGYFDKWGLVDRLAIYGGQVPNIATGDFDGDGDLDVAVINGEGDLILYENRIPRKR